MTPLQDPAWHALVALAFSAPMPGVPMPRWFGRRATPEQHRKANAHRNPNRSREAERRLRQQARRSP